MASTQARQEAAVNAYAEALKKGQAAKYQQDMTEYHQRLQGDSAKSVADAVLKGAGMLGMFIPGGEQIIPAAADAARQVVVPFAGLNQEQVFDDPYTAQNVQSTMKILGALGDIGLQAQSAMAEAPGVPGEGVYDTSQLPTPPGSFSDPTMLE